MLNITTLPIDGEARVPPERPGGFNPDLLTGVLDVPTTPHLTDALLDPDVVLVTTGQQPGLFTGPLYTLYKALSAAGLARTLAQRWQRPVVPLFWIAADDHDFKEAATVHWLNAAGDPITRQLRERFPSAPMISMFRETLGPEVGALLDEYEASWRSSGFHHDVQEWLAAAYRPEASISAAFGTALAALLAPLGIVCFDPSRAAVKQVMADTMLAALEHADVIDERLRALRTQHEEKGSSLPMSLGDGAALVFVEGKLGRDRLIRTDGGFQTRRSEERFTLDMLRNIGATDPTRLSPNVLLRPVVESAILPTVAYIAGPGERRYLPLSTPVYETLDIYQQVPIPRWSGILVEPRVTRVLEKFNVSLDDLVSLGPQLEARVAREHLPDTALAALQRVREAAIREYGIVAEVAKETDPTLERPVAAALHHVIKGADNTEKKLISHQKKREAIELAQIGRARNAVLPNGVPQERVLTVPPFLSQFGFPLLDQLLQVIEAWYRERLAPNSEGS